MKVLLFAICFVAISVGSFALAQVANNAGSVQGAPTSDSVVCNDPNKENPYGTTSVDNSLSPFSGGKKLKGITNQEGTPDDGTRQQ